MVGHWGIGPVTVWAKLGRGGVSHGMGVCCAPDGLVVRGGGGAGGRGRQWGDVGAVLNPTMAMTVMLWILRQHAGGQLFGDVWRDNDLGQTYKTLA